MSEFTYYHVSEVGLVLHVASFLFIMLSVDGFIFQLLNLKLIATALSVSSLTMFPSSKTYQLF